MSRMGTFRITLVASTAAVLTAAMVLAGCGSQAGASDDASGPSTPNTVSSVTSDAGSTLAGTDAPDVSDTGDPASSAADAPSSDDGSAAESPYPVTISAANGDLTISEQPTAIVSLSPTATEDLFAVGAGDQVIAVDLNSNYPDGLPDKTVDAYQLNIEAVTEFEPDLIIAASLTDEQLATFDTLGIPVLVEPAAADLDGAYEQIEQIGAATGHADAAAGLVDHMKSEISEIVEKAPQFDPAATYYYEITDTFYSQTSATFLGNLMGMLGLENIADDAEGAADSGGYPQLSAEYILDSDPDYIFLADTKCCSVDMASVAARPGWGDLQAVTGDRVIELDDDIASRWGPRVVDLLQAAGTALADHPAQR